MLLNVKRVAELLSCSPRTVYRWVDSGLLPQPIRIGGSVRWPEKAVMEWVESMAAGQQPARGTALKAAK